MFAFVHLVASLTVAAGGAASLAGEEGPSLTVYSSADPASFDPQRFLAEQRAGREPTAAWQVPGYGIVRESRRVVVARGLSDVRFADVAQFIDPTTVSCVDATDPETAVLEQRFEFDLANAAKLLDRYVGKEVMFLDRGPAGTFSSTATLLSAAGGTVVLQSPRGIGFTTDLANVVLPSLPDGLITRPTLVWKLDSPAGGEHQLRTTYQTGGLTWRADYNLVLDATATHADLAAWVSLLNLSGATWRDARLKLIAGNVNRVAPRDLVPTAARAGPATGGGARHDAGFEERSFFEYHLYSLPRRVDVAQNSAQQLTLFPPRQAIAAEKVLVYCGLPDALSWSYGGAASTDRDLGRATSPKVDVYVRFENRESNRLGIPLPKGKVRVFQADPADGTLEFVGENLIDHTPKDEAVLLKIGQSFDVVGERVQTDYQSTKRSATESFRIAVRNHKAQAQKVLVRELLWRWSGWEITASSDPFTKVDSRTIHFEVEVPADGERAVTYTAKYSW